MAQQVKVEIMDYVVCRCTLTHQLGSGVKNA